MPPGDRRTGSSVRRWAAALAFALVLGAGLLGYALTRDGSEGGAPASAAVADVRTIHVAVDGDDAAEGSAAAPLRTLEAAVRRSDDGDTILVHSGTYRESLKIEGRPGLRLVAAAGADVWLDGSVVVPEWSRENGLWVSTGWTAEFNASPTYSWGAPDHSRTGWNFVDPAHPLAAHPDQVWIDDERQVQVGSASEVREGTFYVDYQNDELVLGSDPGGATVTASARSRALRVRSADVLVRGIGIRKYAPSVPHMGAVTVEAPGVTLDRVSVTDNATTGVHVLSEGVRLQDVALERNGMLGLSATEADGLELVRLTVRDNNLERFNQSPAAGGAKIGRSRGVLVENSTFTGNLANGLWFDESAYDIAIVHSRVLDNTGHGVSIEVSGEAAVVGNVIARNVGNGLKLNDTEDVDVWNNTFVDNNRSINVVQDDRDLHPRGTFRDPDLPLTWQTQSVAFRNNVIVHTGTAALPAKMESRTCLLCVEDFSGRWTAAEMDVTAAGNVYQRPDDMSPKWLVVWSRRDKDPHVFRTVADFRITVHQEETGVEFTGTTVLSEDLQPLPVLEELSGSVALPLPDELAELADRTPGSRHLGAWTD